jgi:hypothetical protein
MELASFHVQHGERGGGRTDGLDGLVEECRRDLGGRECAGERGSEGLKPARPPGRELGADARGVSARGASLSGGPHGRRSSRRALVGDAARRELDDEDADHPPRPGAAARRTAALRPPTARTNRPGATRHRSGGAAARQAGVGRDRRQEAGPAAMS